MTNHKNNFARITFIFKEVGTINKPRMVQVTLRSTKRNDKFLEEDLQNLRHHVSQHRILKKYIITVMTYLYIVANTTAVKFVFMVKILNKFIIFQTIGQKQSIKKLKVIV